MLNGKTILITGGTGSFGKKFVQIVLDHYSPKKLIVFSRDELKQFEMSQRWSQKQYPCLRYMIGDIRDKERLNRAFNGVDYIVHAAALKQVPAAEYNPEEFIKTNVIGGMNIIDAALNNNVKKIVTLSTDKACNPSNLYGATKLCSDRLFTAANVYSGQDMDTIFATVRYGNVLGSRGSVVPFFKERMATGTLPITDPRMTRFWITLDQGVHFVLKVLEISKGGEIFVPKIPTMNIPDLATAIAPDCKQEVVGIRPGEKIHEVLISEDEGRNTVEYEQCFVINPIKDETSDYEKDVIGKPCQDGFIYSSDNTDYLLSIDELRQILVTIENDYSIESSRWSMQDVPQ